MQLLLDEGYSIAEAVELEKQAQAAEKFAHFWKAAEAVLAESYYTVAEERRCVCR